MDNSTWNRILDELAWLVHILIAAALGAGVGYLYLYYTGQIG
jgi:hypothetical protein